MRTICLQCFLNKIKEKEITNTKGEKKWNTNRNYTNRKVCTTLMFINTTVMFWWGITHVSGWKIATLDSVPWRIVQNLNSWFEIICACALLYTDNTHTHTSCVCNNSLLNHTRVLFTSSWGVKCYFWYVFPVLYVTYM